MNMSENLYECIFERIINHEENMKFTYRLHMKYVPDEPEGFREIYSLEVILIEDKTEENVCLEDISRDRSEAMHIANLFADGTVTPCTAEYIIEDILSEY